MFTGIIEEIGRIKDLHPFAGGIRIIISCSEILEGTKIDDSISINGVCLTVVKISKNEFTVEAVGETLEKTTVSEFRIGDEVNLERALKFSDRIGGHLVQGHINGIGKIVFTEKLGDNYFIKIEVPKQLEKYLISEGSIAIDGISLTIAKLSKNIVGLSIIPHTWKNTILSKRKIGEFINIEIDFLARYVEKFINNTKKSETITEEWLKKTGY
jgi:riboflavin synthase